MRAFIRSERTGNWTLHLRTRQDLLPFLAASGHNWSQPLHQVPVRVPKADDQVRCSQAVHSRSACCQEERSLLSRVVSRPCGGLTRGMSMTETQRRVWCLSRPACAEVNSAMQQLTSVTYETSEQHRRITGMADK